ncbi:hypothetical protein EQG49_10205 [Periweissella cryptocerci]|uniref:Uncharacterized protein n=1 Tax=Periweissella cryptocerci TaxID=2506420 RepID=A0A4P6YVI8_9LACO|nr:hypothetical protein [Periweissella cryptocerci]QBO36808.1 hypothetical protein EQG49_10205 [Periweissella cryptocerci]
MQEYTYTNSTNPFFNNLKNFKRILNIPARKKRIHRYNQMPAFQIIDFLELALNGHATVTVQTNDSFYSEEIHEQTGYLIQQPDGQLVLQSAFSRVASPIMPEHIRHIRWTA